PPVLALRVLRPLKCSLFPTRRSSDLDAGPGRPRPHGSTSRVACGLGRAPTRSVRSLPRADRRGSVARALGRRSLLVARRVGWLVDRKSTRLNSSHVKISYAVFCPKKT